jgi:hypothetical protein
MTVRAQQLAEHLGHLKAFSIRLSKGDGSGRRLAGQAAGKGVVA